MGVVHSVLGDPAWVGLRLLMQLLLRVLVVLPLAAGRCGPPSSSQLHVGCLEGCLLVVHVLLIRMLHGSCVLAMLRRDLWVMLQMLMEGACSSAPVTWPPLPSNAWVGGAQGGARVKWQGSCGSGAVGDESSLSSSSATHIP